MRVLKSWKRIISSSGALALATLFVAGGTACGGQDNANVVNANRSGNANAIITVSTPATASQDTALRNTVEANLTRAGVTGVTVEVANGEVTLKGSIPRARLQDAMKAANDAGPKKVNNQLNPQ
jgi:osmotically-inducible protein OsmY